MERSEEITALLARMSEGDREAERQLMARVYGELRRLARRHFARERPGHTLQATALVNEVYLRLIGQRGTWRNRAHFFGVASQLMRRILVDHAREQHAEKRGGGAVTLPLEETSVIVSAERSGTILALDEALDRLRQFDRRQSRIVEMRFFGGLTEREIAEVLGISSRTVRRDWDMARAWLYGELAS